jgi:hypothetical protein
MEKIISNLTDYAGREFLSFDQLPLNEVDLAIFSKLAYFNWQVYLPEPDNSITLLGLYDISKRDAFLRINAPKDEDLVLFNSVVGNPRYRDVRALAFSQVFSKESSEQFAAITFLLPNETLIVSFRGTDSTWTGWKEDFEMAIQTPVPAQKDASNYLNTILKLKRKFKNGVYVIGHSKGGNLAIYSYLTLNEKQKKKIFQVYSFDGPGLNSELRFSLHYNTYKSHIKKYVPNQSVIGQIYDIDRKEKIVASNELLLNQHSLYSWEVDVNNDCFATSEMNETVYHNAVLLNDWIINATFDEKQILIETIYDVLTGTKISTMAELGKHKMTSLIQIYKQISKLDSKTKKKFVEVLKSFFGFIKNYDKVEFTKSEDIKAVKSLNK